MTFDLSESLDELAKDIMSDLDGDTRIRVQDAMAHRFASIVHNNFGDAGEDRSPDWIPLTKNYALDYHDGDTTPTLVLSGALQGSIKILEGNKDYSAVFTENPYAAEHQWGNPSRNVPARPFFPMYRNGTLTPYAQREVIAAGLKEFERALQE